MNPNEAITAIIPTSPLVCHPSTAIIDETYAQLMKHLPDVQVIVMMDEVHPEEEYLRERYEGFKENMEWTAWHPKYHCEAAPFWEHQSGMLKRLLAGTRVKTPLVFWSEHDIPLNDLPIDWQGIVDTLLDGEIGGIRFELTGDPLKMNEVKGRVTPHGIPLVLSTQFVNWPQVFRLDYLRAFLEVFGNSKTYLECAEFDGRVGQLWDRWQYGIYSPEGEIRRCYHTNGREKGAPGMGKPFIEINGQRRHIYGSYKPLF